MFVFAPDRRRRRRSLLACAGSQPVGWRVPAHVCHAHSRPIHADPISGSRQSARLIRSTGVCCGAPTVGEMKAPIARPRPPAVGQWAAGANVTRHRRCQLTPGWRKCDNAHQRRLFILNPMQPLRDEGARRRWSAGAKTGAPASAPIGSSNWLRDIEHLPSCGALGPIAMAFDRSLERTTSQPV